jgi:hypothetical protein
MRLRLLLLVVFAGCITPSIPIPPPDPTEMQFAITATGSASSAVFTYPPTDAYRNGTVYLYDRANGNGVFKLANADGSFGPTLPLPATAGDQVVVSIEGSEQTVSICVVLQQGAQDPNHVCQ